MSYVTHQLDMRERASGAAFSIVFHLLVLAMGLVTWQAPIVQKKIEETLTVITLNMPEAGQLADTMDDRTKDKKRYAISDVPGEEAKQQSKREKKSDAKSSDQQAPDISDSSANGIVWTPPPPPKPAEPVSDAKEARPEAEPLPLIKMQEGPSPAILVSFGEGRFDDQAIIEVARRMPAGQVGMTVLVDAAGKVSTCSIMVSSGSPLLDQRACELVRSYVYTPAKNADGSTYASYVNEVIEWTRNGSGDKVPSRVGPNEQPRDMMFPKPNVGSGSKPVSVS